MEELRNKCEIFMSADDIIDILNKYNTTVDNDSNPNVGVDVGVNVNIIYTPKFNLTEIKNYKHGKLSLLTDCIPTPHSRYKIINTKISYIGHNNTIWYLYVYMLL